MKRIFALVAMAPLAFAWDEKSDPPRIFASAPIHLVAGEKATLRLRGTRLKDAMEIVTTPGSAAVLGEKKDAPVPSGLEAKEVGDTEVAVELTPPADCAKLVVQLITPSGKTDPITLTVFAKDSIAGEKEPNDGFRHAQDVDVAKPVAGRIGGDKDVDVFRFEARAGRSFTVRVVAAESGSLLDPIVSLHDRAGRLLASADDTSGTRDPVLTYTPKADGPLCIVIADANDRGDAWHEYRLEVALKP